MTKNTLRLRSLIFAAIVTLAVTQLGVHAQTTPQTSKPMRIGFIGSGNIGGAIGELFAKAGHEVFFSSRNPENLKGLIARVGPRARGGTVQEAIAFGDVVFQIGRASCRERVEMSVVAGEVK